MKHLFFFALLASFVITRAAEPQTLSFTSSLSASCLNEVGDYIWGCAAGGVVRINKATDSTTFFNGSNSPLPSASINDITHDSNGKVYIATDRGLVTWHNETWEVEEILKGEYITEMALAANGDIWFILNHFSLGSLKSGVFTIHALYSKGGPAILTILRDLVLDDSGAVWLGTSGGLFKIYNESITAVGPSYPDTDAPNIYTMAIDTAGNIWMGSPDGVYVSSDTSWVHYTKANSNLPHNSSQNISIDKSGTIWVGMVYGALLSITDTTWVHHTPANFGLAAIDIGQVVISSEGYKYISTDKGLQKFIGTEHSLMNFGNMPIKVSGFRSLAFDSTGHTWVGTDSGLVKIKGSSWELNREIIVNAKSAGLATDSKGSVWALGKINLKQNTLARISHEGVTSYNNTNSCLTGDYIAGVDIDENDAVWLATNYGLIKITSDTCHVYNTDNSPLSNLKITSIKSSGLGKVCFVVNDKEVGTFDGASWYFFDSIPDVSSTDKITVSAYRGNQSWFQLSSRSILKYDGTSWEKFEIESENMYVNQIYDIDIDITGNAYIFTSQGLVKYDGQAMQKFNGSTSGINFSWAEGIKVDKHDNVWIASKQGLAIFREVGVLNTLPQPDRGLSRSEASSLFEIQTMKQGFKLDVPFEGPHTVSVFHMNGKSVYFRSGTGKSTYTFSSKNINHTLYLVKVTVGHKVYTKPVILFD